MDVKNEVRKVGDIVHAYSENVIVVSDDAFAWVSLSENISENYLWIFLKPFKISKQLILSKIYHIQT